MTNKAEPPVNLHNTFHGHYVLELLAVALVYILAAKIGLSLAVATKQITTVWPPTAIALVVVYLGGYRYLPGVAVGAFLANATTSEPTAVAAGIALGNTVEAAVGVWLLREYKFNGSFRRARDLAVFMVCIGLISTPFCALLGAGSLAAGHVIAWSDFATAWGTWWAGDAMGGLILGPLLLIWADQESRQVLQGRKREVLIMMLLLLVVTILSFALRVRPTWPLPIAIYSIFPLFIWVAFRFDKIGVTTSTMVAYLAALVLTLSGSGPFTNIGSIERNLVFLESFILVLFITSMLLAITVARRTRAEAALMQMIVEVKIANQQAQMFLTDILDEADPSHQPVLPSPERVPNDTV